jgi:hypothetical protein
MTLIPLQEVHNPVLATYDYIWKLHNVPKQAEFVHAVHDDGDRTVVKQVLDAFTAEVIPRLEMLQKGIVYTIHHSQYYSLLSPYTSTILPLLRGMLTQFSPPNSMRYIFGSRQHVIKLSYIRDLYVKYYMYATHYF